MRALVLAVIVLGWSQASRPDASVPAPQQAVVPCKSVDDCWLDDDGSAIARPRKLRKKCIPRGDCGGNILWLRHRLECVDHRCASAYVADMC